MCVIASPAYNRGESSETQVMREMIKTNAVSTGIGRAAGIAALLAGLLMCWLMLTPPAHAEEEDPFTGTPVLIKYPNAPYPSKVPLAVNERCHTHITCWNILWGGYSYWVLEYSDNHFRIVIAAYDDQGELIAYKDYPGYRYVENVQLDEENEKFLFTTRHKEYSSPLEIPWSDLESLTGVQILLSDAVVKGGNPAVLTAKVKGLSPNVTGQVVFRESTRYGINGPTLHDTPLDLDENGEAALTVDLPPGNHTVVAEYRRVPGVAESYSREYTLLVEGEPGPEPYVEYRSPDDAPIAAPPGTRLRTIFARPLDRYVPMVKWGDDEYWFYEIWDEEFSSGAIIVAAFDRDGIMKGFSDRGTREEEYQDGPYVLKTTTFIHDVSVDMANNRVVVHGQLWNSDNVYIPLTDLVALRQMLISSSTSLRISADTILEKRTVTLVAEVQSSEGFELTGKVKFFSGNVELGTAELQDGAATLDVSDLPVGTHQITAHYLGDHAHESSHSPPVQLVVEERTLAGAPQVIYIPKANAPDLRSEGLYLNCLYQPEGDSVVHCPVIQWGGYDFWLYYDNQRARMFWAALDAEGKPVGYRDAGRYLDLEDMEIDAASKTLTVAGKIAGQPWQAAFDWGDLADVVYSVRVTLTLNADSPLQHERDTVTLTARVTGPEGPFTGKVILLEGDIPRQEKHVTADGTAELEIDLTRSGKYPRRVVYTGDSNYLGGDSNYVTVIAQYPEEYLDFKDFIPIVVYKLPKDRPAQSPGGNASLRCFDSPAGFEGYCPVILYKDFAYWVFAPGNDFAMLVVAYNEDGKIVGSKRYDGNGARYVYDAVVNFVESTIELRGQEDKANIMAWNDLEEMITGTVTELSLSRTQAIEGTPVTLSATVTGYQGSPPTGKVTFKAGETVLGTVRLDGEGKAEWTVTDFAIGKHQLKAYYAGDPDNDPSESDPVELTVIPDVPPKAETVTLRSGNPAAGWAKAGDTVTLAFTANDAVQHVTIKIAGHAVAAEQTDEEGYAWRASYVLGEEDPEGAIAFTLDFKNVLGTAAAQVTSTTDGSSVIYDKTPPTLTLRGDPVVYHEVLTPYQDAGAVASDYFADDETITGRITVNNQVDTTKPGTYAIAYHVQDQAGNAGAEITRTVHVVDTTPPVVTLNGDASEYVPLGGNFIDPWATAWDNYDGDMTANITVTGSVYTEQLGQYTLIYSVTDSSGNKGHAVRTVEVIDADEPVITLKGPVYMHHEAGEPFIDPGAIAQDNADGDISGEIIVTGTVNEYLLGTYILEYNVTDSAGNKAATKYRTLEVADTKPPVIVLLGDSTVTLQAGQSYAEAGYEASDNYDGDLTDFVTVTGVVDTSQPGTCTLIYSVSDSSGNQAQKVRTIHVLPAGGPGDGDGDDRDGGTGPGDGGGDDRDGGTGPGDGGGDDRDGGTGPGDGDGDDRDGGTGPGDGGDDRDGGTGPENGGGDDRDGGTGPGDGGGNDQGGNNGPGNGGGNDEGSGGDAESDPSVSAPAGQELNIYINGKPESVGLVTTTDAGGRQTAVITLNEDAVELRLNDEGEHAVIAIYAPVESETVISELTGRIIKRMEARQAVVELHTDRGSYKIPAPLFNIDEIANRFGADVSLQDIKVRIEVLTPSGDEIRFVEDAADGQGIAIVVPPVSFSIRAVHDSQTAEISTFRAFVERLVAIPEDMDPNRMTTGVYIGPDGSIHHVPTRIVVIDGKTYAQINSLTNSMYSVIWHQATFPDIGGHWAGDIIGNLGNRLVLGGYGDGHFRPDQPITRAEFAAYMVRGLGLRGQRGAISYTDVSEEDWYHDVAVTAGAYGLIRGFADGRFAGSDHITREQAMAIIARAMTLTGLQDVAGDASEHEILRPFTDADRVSGWARRDVATSVQAGIVHGKDHGGLAPQDLLSRAEAAVLIHRLLVQSGLIDE
jgi:hypothetical protein